MDFAWVVDALRRGLKVTRKDWLLAIPPMYLYMVTEKKPDGKHIIKMHPGTSQDFEWTPTAEQMLIVDDWEEYVEPKKEPVFGNTRLAFDKNGQPRIGDTMPFDSFYKGCFNCIWRKRGQTSCDGHPNLIRNAAGIVTECSSWLPRPVMTEDDLRSDQAVEDRSDSTKEARKVVDNTPEGYYKVQLIDALVDAFADKISQRVAQLLQKTEVPLSKEDTNHV